MTPSTWETSKYFWTTASGEFIVTLMETLVKVPLEDSRVEISAVILSKIASMVAIFSRLAGTINLYKYKEGQLEF